MEPGKVVLQTVADEANPNYEPCQDNLRRLRDAGLEVVELPWLPYVAGEEPAVVVPYTNFYICNGGLIVPTRGEETDAEALALIASLYPGREAVAVARRDAGAGRRRGPLHHAAGPRRLSHATADPPRVDVDVVDLPAAATDRREPEPDRRALAGQEREQAGEHDVEGSVGCHWPPLSTTPTGSRLRMPPSPSNSTSIRSVDSSVPPLRLREEAHRRVLDADAHDVGRRASLPRGRSSELLSLVLPTFHGSLPATMRAPPASCQPAADSAAPPGAGM